MKQSKHGLIDKLREAESEAEITELLEEGARFVDAHETTKRRWKRTANKRRRELKAGGIEP